MEEGYAPALARRAADLNVTYIEASDWIKASIMNTTQIANENWKILVKMISGKQIELQISNTCTVGQLKSAVQA